MGRMSLVSTVALTLLAVASAGGAPQPPQQQADPVSTPSEARPGPAAEPRSFVAAGQADQQSPQDEMPAAPTIGGIVTVGLNIRTSQLFLDSNFRPPDTMGAVGPNHIVEFINGNFEVFDKTTGASLETRSLLNFWTAKVGTPAPNNNNIFDPKIIFDIATGRWFAVSEDGAIDANNDGVNEVTNNFYIARSDTDDPRGDWDGVRVVADTDATNPTEFHDYPQVGLDADGLYICTQDFNPSGAESCYSFPKADLLLAAPTAANMTRFENTPPGLAATSGSWQPARNFGLSNGRAPLLGSTGTALQRTDIFGATAAGAGLGTVVAIAGDPGHAAPPAARQPDDADTGDGIETIENVAPRFVANPVVIGDRMWAVHAVDGGSSNSAIRWYEINEATNAIVQTGLIANPNVDFHEPSIEVNAAGNVVIAYTCSGPTLPASVCASVGTTTAGVTTFLAPAILFVGSGTYYIDFCTPTPMNPCQERNRWGDYSATARDPLDPATFWVFQEYTAVDAGNVDVGPGEAEGGNWGVRVVELTFNEGTGGDLAVVKQCEPTQNLFTGQTGFCEISVTNHGPGSALNVVLKDRYLSNGSFSFGAITTTKGSCAAPAGLQNQDATVTCNLGRLPANQTVLVRVEVSADTAQTVNDTATLTTDSSDPDPTNNTAHGSLVFIGNADLQITKTDAPDPVIAGENVTYTMTIRNLGPATAINVVVSDLLPSTLTVVSVSGTGGANCNAGIPGSVPTTCNFATLAASDQETMTIVARVDPSVPHGTVLSNNASVTSATPDNNNSNNLDTTATTVNTRADLTVNKSDSPDPVAAGANLTYTIVVSNGGPSVAREVVLMDTLPAAVSLVSTDIGGGSGSCTPVSPTQVQCVLGDVAAGANRIVTLLTKVAANTPNGSDLVNTATASSSTFDAALGNNSDTEHTAVITRADLWIDKTAVLLTGGSSRTVRFTVTAYNKPGCEADDALSCGTGGPSDAQAVQIVDTLPLDPKKLRVVFVSNGCTYNQGTHTVTCEVAGGVLPAGQMASFIIDVNPVGNVGTLVNSATVSSSTTDPQAGNNTDVVQFLVKGGSNHP